MRTTGFNSVGRRRWREVLERPADAAASVQYEYGDGDRESGHPSGKIERVVSGAKAAAEEGGEWFRSEMFVAVERTTPFERLEAFRETADGIEDLDFRLVGRRTQDWEPPLRGAEAKLTDIRLESREEGYRQTQPAGRVRVVVDPRGFDVYSSEGHREPRGDCDKRTVCVSEQKVDVLEAFRRARQLRRREDAREARRVVYRAMSMYDWAGLYREFVEMGVGAQDVGLFVEVDGDVPVAVPQRVAALARTRRCSEPLREALKVQGEEDLCRTGQRVERMFDERVLVPKSDGDGVEK